MYDHDEMMANAATVPGAETAIFAECCKRNKVKLSDTLTYTHDAYTVCVAQCSSDLLSSYHLHCTAQH
jgi:hypothetical protein